MEWISSIIPTLLCRVYSPRSSALQTVKTERDMLIPGALSGEEVPSAVSQLYAREHG